MFRLKRILFPVDFSTHSILAAPYVDAFAQQFGAELILLYVVQPLEYNSPLGGSTGIHWDDLDRVLAKPGRHIERLTEHGEAASKIVECARTRDVDLIMMQTQGLGVYRRLILGSNTAKVLHDAECPVWTGVHLGETPRVVNPVCRRIVCALDLESRSEKILLWGAGLAAAYGAELTLVHVATDSRRARQELDDLQKKAGTSATVRIEAGEPSKVVPYVAGELNADVVVIGRHSNEGLLGRLATSAYSMIRESPCPVISV